ncbi:MAG: hypothetical protein RLZZ450_2864 [Pseudomonadota bacterium]|jgi:3-methyl-2-oxobutanoate hydroxymethyltransferase
MTDQQPKGLAAQAQDQSRVKRLTVPSIRGMKTRAERIAMVTAYDATFAQMIDEGGADMLLVGDSLGMVVQGLDSTLPVTVDEMIYHCRAVSRGARRALVVGDLPFMSWQLSTEQALKNAARFLSEGGAQAVKLEGGVEAADTVRKLVRLGIPVVGHVGLMPQSVHAMGGFRVQGKTAEAADSVLDDAIAIADAGAFAIVLEGIPSDLAARITASIDIPTIGIGAGVSCDGQVLVCYDLLGLTPNMRPKFVKRYAELYAEGKQAVATYCDEVKRGVFPSAEFAFGNVVRTEGTALRARSEEPRAHALPGEDVDAAADAPVPGGYGPTH